MTTRNSIFAALILATGLAGSAFSQSAPTVSQPAPTPAAATHLNRVLVIPFATLNLTSDQKWIGTAVEETLIADLGKTADYSPVAFQGQTIVEDNATAARLAREASVPYAVRGAAQFVNNEVRLTAQLIEAKSGDTVSTGIVTGPLNNLLKLEDDLAAQLRIAPVPAQNVAAMPPAPLAPAYANPQPVYATPQPTYTAPPDYPTYNNDYPSYDYPVYPYPAYDYPSYPGVVILGGNRGFFHSRFGGGFGGHVGGGFPAGHMGGGFSGGHGGGFSGGHGGGRR